MAQLSFRYSLLIDFDSPVSNHSFSLRCCPQTDERQIISDLDIKVLPQEDLWQSYDGFGNLYISGTVREYHNRFEAVITGKVLTGISDSVPVINELRENIYKYNTRLTLPDAAILDAMNQIVKEEAPGSIREQALLTAEQVMEYLHENMEYVPGSTFVDTSAAEAFERKQGVCQDYAHIMLSMLRSKGICSRYVVGMMEGEGFSHAWVEVRQDGRWYGFDPTNHQRINDRYVKMSHGRDYGDCMINTGCMKGLALQTTYVSASVKEI